MEVKVKCNLPEAIKKFKETFDLEMPKVTQETMRSLIATYWQFTPPKTKKEGTNAIAKDLKHQFIDADYFVDNFVGRKSPEEQERIRNYFRTSNYDALQQIKNAGGMFQNITFKPFNKADIHRNNRGRIPKGHTFIMVTDPKALKAYQKELFSHVGRLKGSMGPAYQHFGGKAPAWIKNNSEGSYVDDSKNKEVSSASATSNVPYGPAVDSRFNSLQKSYDSQARKLLGRVKSGVINKSLRAYYSTPHFNFYALIYLFGRVQYYIVLTKHITPRGYISGAPWSYQCI